MVKFSALSLSTILAAASYASAKVRTFSKKNSLPINGSLLKNARKANSRSLEDVEEEDGQFIDGTYSIKFSQCLDIKTYDADLFDENFTWYVEDRKIMSVKSYVLFYACQNGYCNNASDDDLYITDLSTFLSTVVMAHAEKKENYCRACDEYKDTCLADDGYSNWYNGQYGGDRKLAARDLTMVDCDGCEEYGCFEDEENKDDDQPEDRTDERVAEWIKDLAECSRFENEGQDDDTNWNGLELFYGAICNANGDGIEYALYLDEDCSMYLRKESFADYYTGDIEENEGNYTTVDYASKAAAVIGEAFGSAMSCSQYEAPQDDDANQGDDDEVEEANEYCREIFEESAAGLSVCNYTTDDEGDNDDENQQQAAYNDDGGLIWWTYDMTKEDTDEIEAVCTKVKEFDGNYFRAFKESSTNGGSFFVGRFSHDEWDSLSSFTMSAGEIIVFTLAMVMFAGCCIRRKLMKMKAGNNSEGKDLGARLV